MALTPKITLTATLQDYSGSPIGSSTQPAYLRIQLCNYGYTLPCVPGTSMIGKVSSWSQDIPYTGTQLTVLLWGNDVITPSGTYYAISVLDAQKNVVQTGAFQFTGTVTVDLSQATPYFPPVIVPVTPTVTGGLVVVPYSTTPNFNAALVTAGIVTFEITLTGNVTAPTVTNVSPGQIIIFDLIQDGTGSHTFAWPSSVKNAAIINPAANSRTTQPFHVGSNGNLYPLSGGTYN